MPVAPLDWRGHGSRILWLGPRGTATTAAGGVGAALRPRLGCRGELADGARGGRRQPGKHVAQVGCKRYAERLYFGVIEGVVACWAMTPSTRGAAEGYVFQLDTMGRGRVPAARREAKGAGVSSRY